MTTTTALAAAVAALLMAIAASPASALVAPRSPISGSAAFQGHDCRLDPVRGDSGLGSIDRRWYPVRARGRVRATMLFVDYPGAAHTAAERPDAIRARLATAAIRRYRIASGGRLRLTVRGLDRWLRMPRAARAYDTNTWAGQRALVADAVRAADRSFNFRGTQLLYVVSSRAGADAQSPTLILARRDAIHADGTAMRLGATFGRDALDPTNDAGAQILFHETGHMFGLLDYYRYTPVGTEIHGDVGAWDPMGNAYLARGFTQWSRWLLGWIPDRQVLCLRRGAGRTVTLRPEGRPGGTQLVVVPTSRFTAVAIERRASLRSDAGTCDDGVLVYRTSMRARSGAGPIRIVPARRGSNADDCGLLGHAAFERGPGERCSVVVDRVRIEVVTQNRHTSTVRVRPAATTPDPRTRDCATG
ncbi:MAG: hypothetical protein KDC46_06900 [Thermoleophilia bacterium]|nr:hypothetical protein [Thermoleophilia bacterium]